MESFVQSMTNPFLACLILTGIHVYLGIHVIERKVIFVDLALATLAALGAVWGALLGWDVHEDVLVIRGFSLVFTFVGAAVFSLTRMRHERVPHEAIIGIIYAVALAAIILGSARLPHGAEEVRDLQAGSILWISGQTIGWTALLYSAVGLFHFIFRRQFFAISADPERAAAQGLNVRFWDFLFYVSFGFVVTSSVSVAGVLLVFAYLVIPAVIALLFAQRILPRLFIGWTVGTLVSAAGVTVSYYEDLPSGPVIVVCFGFVLGLAGMLHFIREAPARGPAVLRVITITVLAVAFFRGTLFFRRHEELELAHLLETGTTAEQLMALAEVGAEPEHWATVEAQVLEMLASGPIEVRLELLKLIGNKGRGEFNGPVLALLADPDDVVREQALKCVRELDNPASVEPLLQAAASEQDDYIRVELAEAVLEFGDPRGIPILLEVMDQGEAELSRRDAFEHLQAHVDLELPFQADAPESLHETQLEAYRNWWEQHGQEAELVHPVADDPGGPGGRGPR